MLVAELADWRAVRDQYRAYCRLWRSTACIGKLILPLSISHATSHGEKAHPYSYTCTYSAKRLICHCYDGAFYPCDSDSIECPKESLTLCMLQVPDEAGAAPFADPEHYHRCQSNEHILKQLVKALTLHVPGLVCYWRCHGSARR